MEVKSQNDEKVKNITSKCQEAELAARKRKRIFREMETQRDEARTEKLLWMRSIS
jgi:hypothetical protein